MLRRYWCANATSSYESKLGGNRITTFVASSTTPVRPGQKTCCDVKPDTALFKIPVVGCVDSS